MKTIIRVDIKDLKGIDKVVEQVEAIEKAHILITECELNISVYDPENCGIQALPSD